MTKPIEIKGLLLGSGLPKICVPLTGCSREKLLLEAENAKAAGADLVEWRADFYEPLLQTEKTLETLREISDILGQIPLLFTIRTKEEGGNTDILTKDYVNLNRQAAESKAADLIDVEYFKDPEEMKALIAALKPMTVVVASSHDFEKTEEKELLLERFLEMNASGADILKMAVMPDGFEDVAAIMEVTSEMTRKHTEKPVISMAMGSIGSISRIAGENFGSAVTFGTVGAASAPGQFPVAELRAMIEALHKKNVEEV